MAKAYRLTKPKIKEVIELRKRRYPVRTISLETGVPENYIYQILKEEGL